MRVIALVIVVIALISSVFAQCLDRTSCGSCVELSTCGWCSLPGGEGNCGPLSVDDPIAQNISTTCHHQGGEIQRVCPVAPAVAPAVVGVHCPADATCGVCRETSGCGFCRTSDGTKCGATTGTSNSLSIGAYCETAGGSIATTCTTPVEPVQEPAVAAPSCSSKLCGECLADPHCSYCRGTYEGRYWGVCRGADSTVNAESMSAFCTREGGAIVTAGHCEMDSNVVPPPPVVNELPTTDTICHLRPTCVGCFERPECGLCSFPDGGNACRGKELTVRGETGPTFCSHEGGVWSNSRSSDRVLDVCHVADVVRDVNSGVVTESDINRDLEERPLTGFIIFVTVITQANHNSDGSAHFQTFVDVTGDTEPNDSQRSEICRGIANSLATHLNIEGSEIKCNLNRRTSVKRATTSYVADLTVGQETAGAFHVVASLALIASALLAAF